MSTESSGSAQKADSEIGRPRLLQRVHEAIRIRHYSRRTEEAYVHWIKRLNGDAPRHRHLYDSVPQRAIKEAARAAGISTA